jgi:hypothetical protein
MEYPVINFREKLAKFTEYFSPKNIAQMNDCQLPRAQASGLVE